MRSVLTLILGGGRGTRLYPLTKFRSKPAVPLAGKYRLIDIPISNCINSNLNRVYVLTQFNSVSLHRHIRRTYTFDSFSGGFVEILAAQQTPDNSGWYQGTADAVRQNLRSVQQPGYQHVLILSGDQLYRMNFGEMMAEHIRSKADVTIAALPVERSAARSFGIMRADATRRVTGFLEKPKTDEELALVRTDPAWIDAQGIPSRGRDCLASMGIYLFNRDTLVDMLTKTDYHDFGKEIFPAAIRARRVQLHLFDGYWEDIGTIRSFFDANLALAGNQPPFNFDSPEAPIYTRPHFLPPARVEGARVTNSVIADGCLIGRDVVIENCVIGFRCRIESGVVLRNSVIMGADYFASESQDAADIAAGVPCLGIGGGTHIEGAIIDKNCKIGREVRLVNDRGLETAPETPEALICDGVIVTPKDAVVPHGWRIG